MLRLYKCGETSLTVIRISVSLTLSKFGCSIYMAKIGPFEPFRCQNSVKRQPKSYLTGLVRYPHKQKIGCRDFSRKILDLGSRQASLSHVNRLLNRKARMPQESWALNIKRQLNVSCINMDYYKISNRTLKISHQNCKNISRYYHISFQGNQMNFTPHSKILEIW